MHLLVNLPDTNAATNAAFFLLLGLWWATATSYFREIKKFLGVLNSTELNQNLYTPKDYLQYKRATQDHMKKETAPENWHLELENRTSFWEKCTKSNLGPANSTLEGQP